MILISVMSPTVWAWQLACIHLGVTAGWLCDGVGLLCFFPQLGLGHRSAKALRVCACAGLSSLLALNSWVLLRGRFRACVDAANHQQTRGSS